MFLRTNAFVSHLVALFIATFTQLSGLQAQSNYATPYTFTTMAGQSASGTADGNGSNARFNHPTGVAVDVTGNVYVADTDSHTIRKITPGGAVTTIAGMAGSSGGADGSGSSARFYQPAGVAVDSVGNLYVADAGNNTIRKITNTGAVTTIAGLAGSSGSTDGTGSAARFSAPRAFAVFGYVTAAIAAYFVGKDHDARAA